MRRRDGARTCREDVEEGSKPSLAGVTRALRFWVMESSMEPRDNRRKSALGALIRTRWEHLETRLVIPLSAV